MTKSRFTGFDDELHTIIAALRFWQKMGMCEPQNRSDEFQDLATNGDAVTSLCSVDVDTLVDSINVTHTIHNISGYRVIWQIDTEHQGSHFDAAADIAKRYFSAQIADGMTGSACVFEVIGADQKPVTIDLEIPY